MTLELEGLLITLAFLLPGFLASRLIAARTPAVGRRPTAFEETLESLLRSVYINLVVAALRFHSCPVRLAQERPCSRVTDLR